MQPVIRPVKFCGQLLRLVLLTMAVLLAIQAHDARAQGSDPDYWKQTAERKDTVYRFFYRQSPQAVPTAYDPVAEAERVLRERQAALPPSNPQAPSLWQQIRSITVKEALSTPPRALGTIALGVVGTFTVGWKIGSTINAKVLRLGLPDPPPRKLNPAEGTLVFQPAGYSSSLNTTPLPADGWVLRWWYGSSPWTSVNLVHGWGSPCAYLTGPPQGYRVLSGVSTLGWCENPPVPVESYWLKENELEAAGPIEDYTNQSYDRSSPAPAAPPRTTVEQGIDNELGQPENELLRQWLNYMLGSPGEQDPVGDGVNVPQPASAPGEAGEAFAEQLDQLGLTNVKVKVLSNPDFDPAFEEGAVVRVSPPPGTSAQPTDEVVVTVNRTEQRVNNGECDRGPQQDPGPPPTGDVFSLKDWFSGNDPAQGMASTSVPFRWGTSTWGYRHVEIEHGWDNNSDRSDTQAALLDPAPEADLPGSYRFYFFYVGPNRIPCTRRVVARFDVQPDEAAKRGIITSFAHPGWYRKSDFN